MREIHYQIMLILAILCLILAYLRVLQLESYYDQLVIISEEAINTTTRCLKMYS